MTIVADASLTGAWVLPDEQSGDADQLLEKILMGEEQLSVPDLWSYEMVNLLIAAARRGRIGEKQIEKALDLIDEIPCIFYDHHARLARQRLFRMSTRFSLSVYDASYLELADRLQCRLRSSDRALLKAAAALGLDEG